MDEDNETADNWVFVDQIDCAEEALTFNQLSSAESDQESESSISIISEHPTDTYSEEENEYPVPVQDQDVLEPVRNITTEAQMTLKVESSILQDPEAQSSNDSHIEDISEAVNEDNINQKSHDIVSSAIESSSYINWALITENLKCKQDLTQTHPKKWSYFDCSPDPILEVSLNETEDDSEITLNNTENESLVRKQELLIQNITDKEMHKEINFSRVGVGILISVMVLVASHLIQQYSEYQDDLIQSPGEGFLEGLADNEKAKAIIDFCTDRQKTKGEFSEHAVEKCVIKRLRKKNREEALKKTEIYLQMKARILELREKELAEKEKEILRKWRKRSFRDNIINNGRDTSKNKKIECNRRDSKENNIRIEKKVGYKMKKRQEGDDFDKAYKQNFRNSEGKQSNSNHKKLSKPHDSILKKINKKSDKNKDKFLDIKGKVEKSFQKDKLKQKLKNIKGDRDDPNEEWYIKYNPMKNTVELINITTLSKQDTLLIKNGNKTLNGQWYFSLYGTSRSKIRNKEKRSEWYFKRGNFREGKRDKAKWYFDYMSARDSTRYFY